MNESDKIPNFNFESSFFQFKFVGFLSVKDSGKINSVLKSFSLCVTQRQITALTKFVGKLKDLSNTHMGKPATPWTSYKFMQLVAN